jgi:hypothetical protein
MAETPSYTTVPGRIPDLLKKIRETGVPAKATNEWLRSLGFTSSNDRSLIAVLRQIGFIDATNLPQPAWREYRGADHRGVLGRAVRLGYDMLYGTYPDAHVRTNTELAHVFGTKTTAGKQAIDKMVATFKNLAKEAEFDDTGSDALAPPPLVMDAGNRSPVRSTVVTRTSAGGGVTINVNVQLTIPETTDEKVFEAFFGAMRKHLLDDSES